MPSDELLSDIAPQGFLPWDVWVIILTITAIYLVLFALADPN